MVQAAVWRAAVKLNNSSGPLGAAGHPALPLRG